MNILRTLLQLSICMTLVACEADQSPRAVPRAPSLKDNLPIIFMEARNWDKDAYLYSATVPVLTNGSTWKIRAAFNSPSKSEQSILLTLASTGEMELVEVNHTIPDFRGKPILESDWSIDSDEALAIFISTDPSIEEFLNSSHQHCSDITLERFAPADMQPVVWSLSLFDCTGKSQYYYLDPSTGDLLDLSRSVIPDAILLTPSR